MAVFDIPACVALMDYLTAVVAGAAAAIAKSGPRAVRWKADGSPVTAADEAAEAVICTGLKDLAPGVPILSEEQAAMETAHATDDRSIDYFLVDPLDGTREFIAGRDEFTVNIALVSGGTPILGIVAAPALKLAWRGIVGHGADRLVLAGKASPVAIHTRPRARKPVVMVSRSHLDANTSAYLETLPPRVTEACGSSIKFCRIAEGTADLYPRLAPTHDWDLAAGHAIVTAAGGTVTDPGGAPLVYGSRDFLIPQFIATGDPRTPQVDEK